MDGKFTGKERDTESGLDYFGARYYWSGGGLWLSVDPLADRYPFLSPYLYGAGNPVVLVDADGRFPILSGVVGFAKGIFSKRIYFEGENISRIGYALRTAWEHEKRAWKIMGGWFIWDRNRSFGGKVAQVASRFTWEILQTFLGFMYNEFVNMVGEVSGVEYFHGATFVEGAGYRGGSVSLGSFISLGRGDPEANVGVGPGSYTSMHEYGHYGQSQASGILYLFKYGLPSFRGATWTELDANQRAANYFEERYPEFKWDSFYYRKKGYTSIEMLRYSLLPEGGKLVNPKWWEYLVLPVVPFINKNNPQ